MSLPGAVTIVGCGACGSQLEEEGNALICHDCQLTYTLEDPQDPPTYLDPETGPCECPHHIGTQTQAIPFQTTREADGTTTVHVWRHWTYTWAPCHLPRTHTSMHDWPLTSTYEDRTA